MVLYGPVCTGLVMNCPVWLCMFFEILSSNIPLLSPVRYHILADIENFAFLFVLQVFGPEIFSTCNSSTLKFDGFL